MEVIHTLDRDCSALAGLFQSVINDMKGSGPMWEDFLTRASKLQHALKAMLVALTSFLDAFQRIADAATNTRGATKEVGAALTRICLRHRAVESRVRALTSALVECVVLPLQERVEEWRRSQHALDKDHTKEYKKARSEIKKRAENAARLQKKAKKAGKSSELNKVLESTVVDLRARFGALEEVERTAVRNALTEERARYCAFAHALAPVLIEEVGLVSELGHLQEVMTQLEKHVADPHILPAASEQVLLDIKGGEAQWSWQTPPSSPSSLGSRKSSMCSISSLNSSSSSSTHSPSHHTRPRSVSQGTRLVSVSSQDSGFTSQDTLCQPAHTPALQVHTQGCHTAHAEASGLSEQSCGSEGSTPSPATTNATWPNLTDPSLQHKPAPPLNDRPHTISSAYEKGRDRPPLTVYTFQPPEGHATLGSPQLESGCMSPLMGHTATISRRSSRTSLHHNLSSSSQESLTASGKSKPPVPNRCSSLERPVIPEKKPMIRMHPHLPQQPPPQRGMPQYSSNKLVPQVPDFNKAAPDMIVPQPVYSNMAEICGSVSPNYRQVASESKAVVEQERPGGPMTPGGKGPASTPSPEAKSASEEFEASKYCTLRRYSDQQTFPQYQPGRVVLRRHLSQSGVSSMPSGGTLRRSGSHGHKPPPPVRRTPSISTIPTATIPSTSSFTSLNPSSSCVSLNNSPTHLNSSCSTLSSSSSINGNINSGGSGSPNQGSSTSSPLQRTDSESSTPVGSLENLPPPPAFLLEDGVEDTNPPPDPDLTTPEGIRYICDPSGPPAPIQDKCLQHRTMTVSDTVKNLQESHHQPPSPVTHRRSQSLRCNQPAYKAIQHLEERRVSLEDARASLMTTLNAKLASQMSQQQPKQVQKPYAVREGSQSPRMSRSRLGSVQEVLESPRQPPPSPPVSAIAKPDYGSVNKEPQPVQLYKPTVHQYQAPVPSNYNQVQEPQQMQVAEDRQSSVPQPAPAVHKDPSQLAFLDSLNKKLAQRQSGDQLAPPGSPKLIPRKPQPTAAPTPHPKPHPNGSAPVVHLQRSGSGASEKASKVRQWIASKTIGSEKKSTVETAAMRESLLDQIKRGKTLRKAKCVADRSAPQVS
ncbi:protein MTSS 2-like isoform X3 [Eriocheir sinensis]|uniref:protein MTSS 2-like isoform X3 n=1 Tax=Eriocheir sinensis TaxID=95602 RepID=UPI0021C714E6|nr:protein MTSS 2-like isoform X3 [Eriocheir sinensis]